MLAGKNFLLCLLSDKNKYKTRGLDKAYDAINSNFDAATIMLGFSIQSKVDVGKKHKVQMALLHKKTEDE